MALIVQKYGGTSVSTPERIKNVAKRIVTAKKKGNRLVVVVSAMGDTTDNLIELMKKVNPDPPKRELDLLLSTGEVVSAALLAAALDAMGERSIAFTAYQGGIITDSIHTKARIKKVDTRKILQELDKGKIVVVAGFQGITSENTVTTLGRGGSDTTAVALAAALKADICEIYSDVEGVFTADPRIVPDARKLKKISYDEMLELASLGAKVLHLRAVEVARKFKVPLHIRSSFNEKEGTLIS
ncbi:MAG TPA: aspartate kinase [Candidatus Aerophobetes bacterium]|uniref:Aspartokinase n=1 Tax=Aerophobetes bacterium TaxID=2030807 RepID=A0A7V0MZY0_UNCAE|nr:aspartate kinase [Candidatus Aerophobetes bacterium]